MTQDEQPRVTPSDRTMSRAERRRHTDALRAIRLTDVEADVLASQAYEFVAPTAWATDGMSPEGMQKQLEENDQKRKDARLKFKDALLDREAEAYLKGADTVVDQEARRAYNTRSIVLLLVILAVVLMPVVAIIMNLSPQDFGSYIAPVTGIAGTVVGYWFGERGRTATGG